MELKGKLFGGSAIERDTKALTVTRLENMEITWHPSTPTRFECMAGCRCCCAKPFYLPSEIRGLPGRVKDRLRRKPAGPIEVIAPEPFREGGNHSCCFFDRESALHCSIHRHRPMKCKLYPFLPFVVGDRIEIFAEPFLDIWNSPEEEKDWFNCYGLGRGKDVREEIEDLSLRYLVGFRNGYPRLFNASHVVNDPGNHLRGGLVEKQKTLVESFDEDTVRKMFGYQIL